LNHLPSHIRPAIERVRRFLGRHGVWLWPAVVLLLATSFALHERTQLVRIGGVLRGADPRWVAGAVVIELGALWLTALTYQTVLHRLGHRVAWPALARLHLQRVVVGTVTPVGGPPSLWVLVRTLRGHGVPADDALLAAALRSAVGYAAFLLLLVTTLLLHHPSGQVLIGAVLAAAVFCAFAGGLLVLLAQPRHWHRMPQAVHRFVERAGNHHVLPSDFVRPLGFALLIRLSGAAMLYASLRAVGEERSLSTSLAAYTVGLLFLFLAPIFQGIGVVEMATAAALERMGVPGATALGAALLCRLAELWLPLTLGLLLQALALTRGGGTLPLPLPVPERAASGARPLPGRILEGSRLV